MQSHNLISQSHSHAISQSHSTHQLCTNNTTLQWSELHYKKCDTSNSTGGASQHNCTQTICHLDQGSLAATPRTRREGKCVRNNGHLGRELIYCVSGTCKRCLLNETWKGLLWLGLISSSFPPSSLLLPSSQNFSFIPFLLSFLSSLPSL